MQVSSRCLAADAITSIAYPRIGVSTTIDLNARGSLLKSSTGTMTQTHFEQRLSYDELGRIGAQWASLGTERAQFNYNYDGVDRLIHEQYWNPTLPNPINEWRGFQYDRVGNRITSSLGGTTVAPSNQTYTYPPASNRLLQFTEGAPLAPPTRVHTLAYDPDGALQTRTRNDLTDGMEVQRIETFAYDAFELIHRYTVRRDVAAPGAGLGCAADAAQQPMDDWRYRFGPLQEREQKRQYATAGNAATDGLAWTYTLLGADAKQLATYNGVQGAFCGQPAGTVWMWPVEHNAWGPAGTRIIMRPTGAREYVVHDHLGSARLTYDNTGGVVERRSYRAFGVETQSDGEGARTSYIGREKDNESDLGFGACPEALRRRVRMYEPDYGRFLSVDPLWMKYLPLQPYQYAGNDPVNMLDDNGKEIVPINLDNGDRAMLQMLIGVLRNTGDVFIAQILDHAEGCESQIHVYAFPRTDPESIVSSTSSRFGYETTIETLWSDHWDALGITSMNSKMRGRQQADLVLASDLVLGDAYSGTAALALLDELHHAYSGKFGIPTEEQHVHLFSYLLEKMQSGALQIPGLTIADVQAKLKAARDKVKRHPHDPATQPSDGGAGTPKVQEPQR